ncbi:hypothetical protein HUB98_09140 [Paenibacillus barcinonensis]|uniref:Uncharacterized protein n=1 Tax=Paenibacillus barcinonensis TaxID=198119 RepID=A0A2V4VBR3_PAEBA|nr:hypothetical protein [Paenibacillus barcinonensis]PYE49837.1 hypothetical protein DFQ00_105341 [Paenibacillus barcinonensis]QKS56488.1 hypothetical protein HUB98_09140 [Paenibacillus barcinonensis]
MPKFVTGDQIHFYEGPRKIVELSVEEVHNESYNWFYHLEPGDEIFGKIRPKRTVDSITMVKDGHSEDRKSYLGGIYHVHLRS